MRAPLFARLLLVLALLFAQLGGLTHEFSHELEGQSQDQSLLHGKYCDQCAAYAQIGSAIGCSGIDFLAVAICESPYSGNFSHHVPNTFAAFAARAPPFLA